MNLVCAAGLPGSEGLDIAATLQTLDDWADVVRRRTGELLPRLLSRPQRMSEAQMRLWLVIRIVRDEFGIVHVDQPRADMVAAMVPHIALGDEALHAASQHFTDSRNVFIHGLLGHDRAGTCSSIPVLYAAIARRLGYPVKLATSVGHVFNRWESPAEAFNMEGTGFDYISQNPDDYYIDTPRPWTEYERYSDYLLRGRTPAEELSLFHSLRAACFDVHGDHAGALDCWTGSWRLMPACEAEASNMRHVLKKQLKRRHPHSWFPTTRLFDTSDPNNQVIAIAPVATQAALFAARGIRLSFECDFFRAFVAFETARVLAPDDPLYADLAKSIERWRWDRLPPSKSVKAAAVAAEEAQSFLGRKLPREAITRLAKAYRLDPRRRDYWLAIGHVVRFQRPDAPPPPNDRHSGRPVYTKQDVAWLLRVHGDVFLRDGNALEARRSFEEALHLTPHDTDLRAAVKLSTRGLHEAAQAERRTLTEKE
jgi:tetratricopeptide (TPR) repeat protein